MLDDVGVRRIRRWLMWAVVAARSRWQQGWAKKALLSLWVAASLAGYAVYLVLEFALSLIVPSRSGSQPIRFFNS